MLKSETKPNTITSVLKELDKRKVKIGIVGESDSKLLTYAAVQEYGANIKITEKMRRYLNYIGIHTKAETTHIVIPERSYIRSTMDNKNYREELKKKIQPMTKGIFDGSNTVDDLLEFIGIVYVSNVKKTIANMTEPPLHPVTVKRKTNAKGQTSGMLIDGGRLVKSIDFEVA